MKNNDLVLVLVIALILLSGGMWMMFPFSGMMYGYGIMGSYGYSKLFGFVSSAIWFVLVIILIVYLIKHLENKQ